MTAKSEKRERKRMEPVKKYREWEVGPEQAQDLLENMGILQEINRTILNPLGLRLDAENGRMSLFQTENPAGFVLDALSRVRMKTFRVFANSKHKTREKMFGFVIQFKDAIRGNEPAEELPVDSRKSMIKALSVATNSFMHGVYTQCLLCVEKGREPNLDIEFLKRLFRESSEQNEYVVSAFFGMLISQMETIERELKKQNEK